MICCKSFPFSVGKCFPFPFKNVNLSYWEMFSLPTREMGNGKCFPSHWEKSPPFTLKRFPFLLVNVSFPIWEMFSLPTGTFTAGKPGNMSSSCRKMFHLFKGEPLIFPVGYVCPFIFPIGNVPSSLPTALVMFLLSREKALKSSRKFLLKMLFMTKSANHRNMKLFPDRPK